MYKKHANRRQQSLFLLGFEDSGISSMHDFCNVLLRMHETAHDFNKSSCAMESLHHPSVSRPLTRCLFLNMCPNPTAFSITCTLAAVVYETLWVFVLKITYSAMAIFIVICPCIAVIVRLSFPYKIISSKASFRRSEHKYTGMPYTAVLAIVGHVKFIRTIEACCKL